jgi:hypothetical protein
MRFGIREVLAFALPVTMAVQIELVGKLLASDVLSLCVVTACLMSNACGRELFSIPRSLLFGYVFWLVGAVITDIYRDTPFDDLARGWSKIAFFGVSFLALYMLSLNRLSVLRAYLLGICVGWLVKTVFFPDQNILEDPWKFGYSQAITPFVAMVASARLLKRSVGLLGGIALLLGIAAVNLGFNARNMFGISGAAALFCLLKQVLDWQPALRSRVSPIAFVAILTLGLVLAKGLISVYATVAGSGVLGIDAQEKYETQSAGDVGVLLSGRNEIFASFQAIVDSPILGHGSWARDMTYVQLMVARLEEFGVAIEADVLSGVIPAHSHVFGAWVEAGIGGGFFWAVVFWFAVVALYRTLKLDNLPTPLIAWILISMFWNILFSPFGSEQRVVMAFDIALTLWVLRQPVRKRRVV